MKFCSKIARPCTVQYSTGPQQSVVDLKFLEAQLSICYKYSGTWRSTVSHPILLLLLVMSAVSASLPLLFLLLVTMVLSQPFNRHREARELALLQSENPGASIDLLRQIR